MIKGFRNKLRLFSNEPKTETNQLFSENPDKNGFHFKVIETQYSSSVGGSATDRLTDQQALLLEKIMVGNRRDDEKKKLKKNEINKVDTETVVAVVESVNNSNNIISDENNREVIESNNIKNLDQDADTVTNNNTSNNSNQHPDVDGSERATTASSSHGSVKDLPIAESEVAEKKDGNNEENDKKIKSTNASIVTDSESILNEATDKITSIPFVEGSGYPEHGSYKDSPRRSYSQRENRIVNPRLRKLSVPARMEHDGPQAMGNRMRKTSSPLPGETYREMMERHAVAQQERQRRNSYIVPPVTSRGSLERMTSSNDEFRRRRMSSASSTSSGDSRRSSVDSRYRRSPSVCMDFGETGNEKEEKQRNDFYLNLPLLL